MTMMWGVCKVLLPYQVDQIRAIARVKIIESIYQRRGTSHPTPQLKMPCWSNQRKWFRSKKPWWTKTTCLFPRSKREWKRQRTSQLSKEMEPTTTTQSSLLLINHRVKSCLLSHHRTKLPCPTNSSTPFRLPRIVHRWVSGKLTVSQSVRRQTLRECSWTNQARHSLNQTRLLYPLST